jgi:hypothetical protein
MPIKPENAALYPANWKTEIRPGILGRAQWRCEACCVANHAWGWRDHRGGFHEVCKESFGHYMIGEHQFRRWPPFEIESDQGPLKIIKIVLTIAHLDHDPRNCAPENLRAWCQRCHLAYDLPHHQVSAYMTRRAARNTLELPL